MTTTLKDVALRAGASIKTVSNVVHGNVRVTEEKRERVRAALDELNYQPNLPARYLFLLQRSPGAGRHARALRSQVSRSRGCSSGWF